MRIEAVEVPSVIDERCDHVVVRPGGIARVERVFGVMFEELPPVGILAVVDAEVVVEASRVNFEPGPSASLV